MSIATLDDTLMYNCVNYLGYFSLLGQEYRLYYLRGGLHVESLNGMRMLNDYSISGLMTPYLSLPLEWDGFFIDKQSLLNDYLNFDWETMGNILAKC